jgi:phenylacetate-CoA ligase
VTWPYDALPIWSQNVACTLGGYWRSRRRFSRHFQHSLDELEASYRLPLEERVEIQRQELRRLVERARNHVPYYRDLAPPAVAEDPEEEIRRTLAEIPPLEKGTYRGEPHAFLRSDIPRHRLVRGKTSGTTGTALPLWYTPEAVAREFACVWRGRRHFGANVTDANLTFNGQLVVPFRQNGPPFWRTNYWNRQSLFSIHHCSERNLASYVDAIHERKAEFAQGYPSFIHLVARAMLDRGRPLSPGRLKGVFTSSESLLAFQRETIERAFGAPVRDRYGVSEFAVSMTECEASQLHVDLEFGIVEVEVEQETDDWIRGPLLVTGFANDATALLRYRVGDIGTRSKHPCPCGRPGDVFLDVDGRIEDYVLTPDGRLVGRLDHIFKEQLDVAEAQILQEVPESLDVLVVRRDSFDEMSSRRLLKEFRSRLGDEIGIELRFVPSIPREPNGKFRAVKSRVGRLQR